MNQKIDDNAAHQRGLRISKPHAEEIVNIFGKGHVQSEFLHATDLLLINYAHVLMLCEQNLISHSEACRILSAVKQLETAGVQNKIQIDPRIGDLSTHVEAFIIKETGADTGGKLHTGRSRNDLYPTLTKMRVRRSVMDVYGALITLCESLLWLADKHKETAMPGYTHYSQHAQPITLGYYLLGNFDVFRRNLERIEHFWGRMNTCPMGAAALSTTGFPLDRHRVAALLGFDDIHEHAYDAVSARDFLQEFLFILSTIASDLGRIAENILLWNTFEFGMIVLADEYTSFSTIMPQKKNPVALETPRALNSIISGKLYNAFGILKAESWCNGRETTILDDDSADTGEKVFGMIRLMDGVLRTMQVQKERMAELARRGFSVATELADTLVRDQGFPFRTAHEIVGLVVKNAVDRGLDSTQITVEMIEACAEAYTGNPLSLNPESVRKALDPKENVQIRCLPGGPAVKEVSRMLKNRKRLLDEKEAFISRIRSNIEAAYQTLSQKVKETIGEEHA